MSNIMEEILKTCDPRARRDFTVAISRLTVELLLVRALTTSRGVVLSSVRAAGEAASMAHPHVRQRRGPPLIGSGDRRAALSPFRRQSPIYTALHQVLSYPLTFSLTHHHCIITALRAATVCQKLNWPRNHHPCQILSNIHNVDIAKFSDMLA
jgi:hypothetical protein